MNIATWLLRSAQTYPDNPAVSLGSTAWASYQQLAVRVSRLAGALRSSCRLGLGERVAIAMTNAPEFMEVLLAAWHAGLAAVPVNAKLHAREFAYILDDVGARLCVVSEDLAATIAPLAEEIETLERVIAIGDKAYGRLLTSDAIDLAEVPPEAPAWIFYTSGTTGRPKGAVLSHRNLMAMTMNYFADVDQVAPVDGIVHAAPLSHGSGLYGLPHLAKAAKQIVPESRGFDPAEVADLCRTYRGLTFFFAPTMVVRLLASPALADLGPAPSDAAEGPLAGDPLPGLKTIVYGGGPMYVSDLERALDRLGPRLVQIYGQGEAPMTITALSKALHAERGHPDYRRRLASVGTARSDVELMVVDAEGRPLPPGETGEVCLRGTVVMEGYWRKPEATAAALKEGWLHTGDLGAMDAAGFLTLKDRAKDLVISGGANIYPREVEEVLLRHSGVAEASVIGLPDADWGERVVAFVVPAQGRQPPSEAELDRLCLDHIARFKRPKAYRFVESLPKNNYGKVLKTALRQRWAAARKEEAGKEEAGDTPAP